MTATTTVASPPTQRAPVASWYLIVHAPGVARAVPFNDGEDLVAGRGQEARLHIECSDVSRAHAVFRRRGAAVEVEDLGSRNGSWIDGHRIDGRAALTPGAAVRIGPARIALALCADTAGYSEPASRNGDGAGLASEVVTAAGPLIVADEAMRRLYADAQRVARTPCAVMINGETGAGKEVIAEYVHRASPRATGPLIRLNCAAIPETLLESELFGHERGAFTGADRRRDGWIAAASGGTLFLDEIGEMPLAMQAKLLRVLESGRVMRVGATTETTVDVRLVCATHRDLQAAIASGTFRADLFYRLAGVVLAVPPLRERPSEIALLAARFAAAFAGRMGALVPAFEPETTALLLRHRWPGNIRELRNAIERAVALCRGGRITPADLPETIRTSGTTAAPGSISEYRDDAEREAITAALASEGGNRTHAARRLGISRRSLIYKLAKYELR